MSSRVCSLATAIVVGDFMTTIFFFKWSVRNRFLFAFFFSKWWWWLCTTIVSWNTILHPSSVLLRKKEEMYIPGRPGICHFLLSRTLNLVWKTSFLYCSLKKGKEDFRKSSILKVSGVQKSFLIFYEMNILTLAEPLQVL